MTTMYLRNRDEIAAANRAIKASGYNSSVADLLAHDRYVTNIVDRLGGGIALEDAITEEVFALRDRKADRV